jgi:hypothetical protein
MILYVKKFEYLDKELISLLTNNNNYNSNNVCNQNITIIPSSLTSSLTSSKTTITLSSSSSSTTATTTTTIPKSKPSSISDLILATSFYKKRKYLEDYKDFKEAFYLKSIALQLIKAVIADGSALLLDYTQYLDKLIEAEKEGIEIDEYDMVNKIILFLNKCRETSIRFLSVSWIKKSYELYATLYFDHRIADKLTKDISKSLIRKISRMSRFEASRKIIKTTLNASAIFALSSFTYDILYNIYDSIMYKKQYSFQNITIWVFKKCTYYFIVTFGSAVGFSIGSYIGGVRIGGLVGLTLGDIGATVLSATLLKI